jgi:hypothetical protein
MRNLNTLLAFATTSFALTFTAPFSGTTVDLSSPFHVTWVPGPSDPSTFTLSIVSTISGSSDQPQTLATDIRTSSGSYTVPANTIISFGDDFELVAADSSGNSLATSPEFGLADGVYSLQTASDGVLTIATSITQGSAPSSTVVPPAVAATTGGAPESSASEGSNSPSNTANATASNTAATTSQQTSSAATSSSSSSSSGHSSTSTTTAASSSSSSSSNSNLGFNSAVRMGGGSRSLYGAGAVVMGALALFAY